MDAHWQSLLWSAYPLAFTDLDGSIALLERLRAEAISAGDRSAELRCLYWLLTIARHWGLKSAESLQVEHDRLQADLGFVPITTRFKARRGDFTPVPLVQADVDLAIGFALSGMYDAALESLERALAVQPTNGKVLALRARILAARRDE